MSAEPVAPLSWYQSLKRRAEQGDVAAKRSLEKHKLRNTKARKRREAAAKKAQAQAPVSEKRVTSIPLDAIPAPAKRPTKKHKAKTPSMQQLLAALAGRPPISAVELFELTDSSATLKGLVSQLHSLVRRGAVRETKGAWDPTLHRATRLYELRPAKQEILLAAKALPAHEAPAKAMKLTLKPGTDITVNIGGVEVSIVVAG